MRRELNKALTAVKKNRRKLDSCDRHRFDPKDFDPRRLGHKMTCTKCGGALQLTDVGMYIRGYVACGGSADDIWPGFSMA